MRSGTFRLIGLLAFCVIAVTGFAQDPLSGTWAGDWGPSAAHRNPVTVDLKWDGANLTGTVNPGPNALVLQKASYDAATGTVKMETDAPARRGGTVRFVIEGKVSNGALTGSWSHDGRTGDFKVVKK